MTWFPLLDLRCGSLPLLLCFPWSPSPLPSVPLSCYQKSLGSPSVLGVVARETLNPWMQRLLLFSCYVLSPWTLCNTTDCSTPGFPVLHYLPEFAQTHVHWVGDAIQPSHPLLPPSAPALNLSQHQWFFQWVSSSHRVAKLLELQLQHQSFQWIFRVDFL